MYILYLLQNLCLSTIGILLMHGQIIILMEDYPMC